MTLLDLPKIAREVYGVHTIELVSEFFPSQTAGYLNQLRRTLIRHQVRVHSIAVDQGSIGSADPGERRTSIEALKQWFFVARAIDAGAIRVNTDDFEPLVQLLVERRPLPKDGILFNWSSLTPEGQRDVLERRADAYAELATVAATVQVKVLIEYHGGATGDPTNIAYLLDSVESPWLATCPDNHNPYDENAWEAGTRVFAPRAYTAHVKISGYDPRGIQTFPSPYGESRTQDLPQFLAILREEGYHGPLNLEYNFAVSNEEEGARKGLAYLRDLVARA